MSTWQGGQEASDVPSFPAGPGPREALLVLGQWALERGHGGCRVPTEDKEPSVGSGLLGSDQLQLPHWQELGVGWGWVSQSLSRRHSGHSQASSWSRQQEQNLHAPSEPAKPLLRIYPLCHHR